MILSLKAQLPVSPICYTHTMCTMERHQFVPPHLKFGWDDMDGPNSIKLYTLIHFSANSKNGMLMTYF